MPNTTGIVAAGQPIEATSIRLVPAGTIVWYSGNISAAGDVSGFLVCNGAGYSSSIYGRLYSAIGTAYGSGDGTSTDFNVPDLTGLTPDETNIYGYFIRATDGLTGSKSVGSKEHDTIRNIRGASPLAWLGEHVGILANHLSADNNGAIGLGPMISGRYGGTSSSGSSSQRRGFSLDANADYEGDHYSDYMNPMAGHTTEEFLLETQDTHPFTIFMIPLISY